ncbi:MAG TPA: beta-propeller fold lactonase family protein [Candidatus Acidoferrales bacterium]|nr:beta-propeller fold lactonase family protein [Candidatus Acidoferrales bacterium]
MRRRQIAGLGALVALLAFSVPATVAAHNAAAAGTVYTITNSAGGNTVLAYSRASNGSLSLAGTYATGGTGAQLTSQGSVTLSADGRWLAAVDAGSNDVALFAVAPNGGLYLTSRAAAGGTDPISVTIHGPFVYVLDAGDPGNIAGFLNLGGRLVALPRSIQPLSGSGTSPEEIAFSPSGGALVVTEKGAGELVTYRVGFLGIAGPPSAYPSSGAAPYGFDFDSQGRLFVTEAAASALSSYTLSSTGVPSVISPPVLATQPAACWIALTPDGRYAFTIDAHNAAMPPTSAAISTYAIAANGGLTLVSGTAATKSTPPLLDATVSGDGHFLYVVDVGAGAIDAFRIGAGASLSPVGSTGLPAGAGGVSGLAAS